MHPFDHAAASPESKRVANPKRGISKTSRDIFKSLRVVGTEVQHSVLSPSFLHTEVKKLGKEKDHGHFLLPLTNFRKSFYNVNKTRVLHLIFCRGKGRWYFKKKLTIKVKGVTSGLSTLPSTSTPNTPPPTTTIVARCAVSSCVIYVGIGSAGAGAAAGWGRLGLGLDPPLTVSRLGGCEAQ